MNDEDVPFMNYRVTWCRHCERVLNRESEWPHSDTSVQKIRMVCPHCESDDVVKFITGGMKGCMLIWDEQRVA